MINIGGLRVEIAGCANRQITWNAFSVILFLLGFLGNLHVQDAELYRMMGGTENRYIFSYKVCLAVSNFKKKL